MLKNFKSLRHRSEIVYKDKKMIIINDSKATNLSSALHSIKLYNNIYLIMGGKLKNKNFDDLKLFKNKIKKIYLIGESSKYIIKKIKDTFICDSCEIMSIAVKKCFKDIKINNSFSTLLLAPACSSFDQYNNYEERGDDFINISKKIINKNINE